jgi:hypothetical protein
MKLAVPTLELRPTPEVAGSRQQTTYAVGYFSGRTLALCILETQGRSSWPSLDARPRMKLAVLTLELRPTTEDRHVMCGIQACTIIITQKHGSTLVYTRSVVHRWSNLTALNLQSLKNPGTCTKGTTVPRNKKQQAE